MNDKESVEDAPTPFFPFTLKIPEYGRQLKFSDTAQMLEWVEKEISAWADFNPEKNLVRWGGEQAVQWHRTYFAGLKAKLDEHLKLERSGQCDHQNAFSLRENISERLWMAEVGGVLALTGREGVKAREALATDHAVAFGYVIRHWTRLGEVRSNGNNDAASVTAAAAMIDAAVHAKNLLSEKTAADKALGELANEWEEKARKHVSQISQVKASADTVVKEAAHDLHERRQAADDAFTEHKNKMDGIQKRFNEFIKLDAPAKLWRNKRTVHLCVAAFALAVFAAFIALGIGAVWKHGPGVLQRLVEAENGTIGLGSIGLVTLPALAYFWFLRLISRVFVTNLNGIMDAGLRAAMVTTFLTLIEDNENPVSGEERLLILQALFRAPSEGGDDGAPASLLDAAVKKIEQRPN